MVIILEKALTHFTDKIITLTELEKNDLINFKICNSNKITVINSGIELEKYKLINFDRFKKRQEFSIHNDENVVGIIGRLDPIKGPQFFIEASNKIIEKLKNIKFLIVGDGILRKSLESQVKNLGIRDKFIFTGWREDTPEIISILDICILPSLNEAVGRALLEAQAAGVPVVANNVGGIPEIVKHGETGILLQPKDSKGLQEAIISLLQDKSRRLRMGQAAKNWVGEQFSQFKMIDKVHGLYNESKKQRKDKNLFRKSSMVE